ncbi:hypothetical protein HID58_022706 [Brassica napus]|uniref:Transmembrane protein n=1 Tax=Brassica napus TaxID=3708 RepID=A0ABQ8D1N8_BRANA|nr:hypothetical protein HID58_022706 [Brassica napus]
MCKKLEHFTFSLLNCCPIRYIFGSGLGFCHGIRFVTVRHVPVVAGETRPFSDVGSPGGGDVCGFASQAGCDLDEEDALDEESEESGRKKTRLNYRRKNDGFSILFQMGFVCFFVLMAFSDFVDEFL